MLRVLKGLKHAAIDAFVMHEKRLHTTQLISPTKRMA